MSGDTVRPTFNAGVELTLVEKLAYILDNAPPDSPWRQTVEYTVEATYELIREERGDLENEGAFRGALVEE